MDCPDGSGGYDGGVELNDCCVGYDGAGGGGGDHGTEELDVCGSACD